MVARSGVYFGTPLKGQRRVTQGKTLCPTILNVMVDTVLRHWVSVVAETEGGEGPEGFGRDIYRLAA